MLIKFFLLGVSMVRKPVFFYFFGCFIFNFYISKKDFVRKLLGFSFVLSMATNSFAASNVNGSIDGRFVDANGNQVSGVEVTITNEEKGFRRTISTGSNGSFKINVPGGDYKVSSVRPGYESVTIEKVSVAIGTSSPVRIVLQEGAMEEVLVVGNATQLIKTGTAESSLNISLEEVAKLPVPRTIESVALLAPGTVLGDSDFGEDKSLVSFSGSSVGENAYFIDGLNVTNFRNGLGGSSVPFEFYDQFQIKSGGYGAEFGRSLGGVLNAVVKKGSNDFNYGLVSYYEPAALRENASNVLRNNGSLYDLNSENERSIFVSDLYVSGALIQDKLFFYALYEYSDTSEEFNTRGTPDELNDRVTEEPFWGGSLVWNITDNHALTLVAFSDERTRENSVFEYDVDNRSRGNFVGVFNEERGGDNMLVRYDGQLSDSLSLSVLWGENEYNLTNQASTDITCPLVVDVRAVATSSRPGCETNAVAEIGGDKREALRVDFEWEIGGGHTLAFGVDNEDNESDSLQTYSGSALRQDGGVFYRYFDAAVGSQLANGGIVPDINGDGSNVTVVRYRIREVGGAFETKASAWYIEDTWVINDNWTVSAGLRNETFENLNSNGDTFIEIDEQLAPRLSASWDPNGDGSSRVYAHWGRYFLPVAANTNVRLSGNEFDNQRFFIFDGQFEANTFAPVSRDANTGLPTTQEIGSVLVTANGVVPNSAELADRDIDPMHQDELILGYEREIEDWLVGVKYIKRELKSHIDDVILDHAIEALGLPLDGGNHYVLANPGSSITIPYLNNSGDVVQTTFSADILNYPRARREYEGLEFSTQRSFDRLTISANYLWSSSKGNTEGYVKSDNGQDDAGITTDFDFPELTDGAFGRLPNDRTHQFKIFGSLQATENLTLGLNMLLQSGRPINSFGTGHPNGTPAYGQTYYLTSPGIDGNVGTADDVLFRTPRGSRGRTSWVSSVDFAAIYSLAWGAANIELRADVFNLFDAQAELEVFENAETAPGVADIRYGIPTSFQAPRTFRFGVAVRF